MPPIEERSQPCSVAVAGRSTPPERSLLRSESGGTVLDERSGRRGNLPANGSPPTRLTRGPAGSSPSPRATRRGGDVRRGTRRARGGPARAGCRTGESIGDPPGDGDPGCLRPGTPLPDPLPVVPPERAATCHGPSPRG